MDTTIKKMIEIINIVNKSTRKYLNKSIDNQTTDTKALTKNDIKKAFDDINLQTNSYDLILDQKKFILQINYFNQYAILRWLQVKNSLAMGNYIEIKDIKTVFDQVDQSVLKTSKKMNKKVAK